ncbi:MAG: galactokinase [Clostridiales bacterium]|nr:galactokinase [Clostridiales bacterium]
MIGEKEYEYKVTAAGRVNIIGEHIDYCGGKVFPAALGLNNTVYIRPNNTDKINIRWTTLDFTVSLDINRLDKYYELDYGNYLAGSLFMWQKAGGKIVGVDMVQDCHVPFGSGLSSSAAIETSTIAAMCAITGTPIDNVKIALTAQKAEREYMGVNCGIMDQYASACGKKNHAMLLDCNTLDCEYVPLDLGDCSLVIINCKKPHNLVESKYNERRKESEEALKILQTKLNVSCLAEVKSEQLCALKNLFTPIIYNRAKHIVEECERVNAAAKAMKAGDMTTLGKLLNASHTSLRDLYEVTGEELDALAAAAQSHPACLGSRMTGGGFGGCTVSLVKTDKKDDFVAHVLKEYKAATGYTAEVYTTDISDGITVEKL